jgi:hypothetical protein
VLPADFFPSNQPMASLPRYSTAPLLPLLLGPIRLLLFPFAYVCDPDSNRPFYFCWPSPSIKGALHSLLEESSRQLSDWLVKGSAGLAITTKLSQNPYSVWIRAPPQINSPSCPSTREIGGDPLLSRSSESVATKKADRFKGQFMLHQVDDSQGMAHVIISILSGHAESNDQGRRYMIS